MKKNLLLLVVILIFSDVLNAQTEKCGAEKWSKEFSATPEFQQLLKKRESRNKNILHSKSALIDSIPVVVHVLWSDPSMNIPDSLIFQQIQILNEDLARENADTVNTPAPFKSLSGSAPFRFVLARRTPDGAFTTGIIRRQTTHPDFEGFMDLTYTSKGGDDAWLDGYMNLYCAPLIPTMAGVGQMNFPLVVIDYMYWGYSGGIRHRVGTHEIGHSLGELCHIWGSEVQAPYDCASDDGIADTPPQTQATSGCPAFPSFDSCTPSGNGIMYCNYMDYSSETCQNMFTAGQTSAMVTKVNMYQPGLLTSNGAVAVKETDAGITDVLCPLGNPCTTFSPLVELRNKGMDTLTSALIYYKVDANAPVLAYTWSGILLNHQTEMLTLPSMTLSGFHNIRFFTSMPNGLTDQDATNDTTRRTIYSAAAYTFPFAEGFEGTSFPLTWGAYNPDQDNGWMRSVTIGHTGTASLYIDNGYDFTNHGHYDEINTRVNLSTAANPYMSFYVANTTSAPLGSSDTLEIYASADCGLTYTMIYKKYDSLLYTAPIIPFGSTFIPTATQWRKDSVSLSDFTQLSNDVIITFRDISAYGLELYIDDVNIHTVITGIDEINNEDGFALYPNPNNGNFSVKNNELMQEINIFNAIGEIVFAEKNINENIYDLDFKAAPGVYVLSLKTAKGILHKRFVVN